MVKCHKGLYYFSTHIAAQESTVRMKLLSHCSFEVEQQKYIGLQRKYSAIIMFCEMFHVHRSTLNAHASDTLNPRGSWSFF